MTTGEFSSAEDGVIRGSCAEILIDDADGSLHDYLSTASGPEVLYKTSPGDLSEPISFASLEFYKNNADNLTLFANVSFNAKAVADQELTSWQNFIGGKLADDLRDSSKIYRVPHQEHDFYVVLDTMYAAHIQFGSDAHECFITIKTELLDNLFGESAGKHRDIAPEEPQPLNHVELTRRFAHLWSMALDDVSDEFGPVIPSDHDRPRIVISSPLPKTEQKTAGKEVELYTQRDIPAIEMGRSRDDGFDLIGGLTQAKEKLRDIAAAFADPIAAHMYQVPTRHFLLHGPPGTGKSSLVYAFGNEIGAKVVTLKSTDIVSKWVGVSGRNVRNSLQNLMRKPKDQLFVAFFEEFEALAFAGRGGTQERVDIKKQLNILIDEISRNHRNVIIASATNADIADLEPSLVRSGRIEPIGAPNPNEEERCDVWAAILTESIRSFGGMRDVDTMDNEGRMRAVFVPYDEDIDVPELARLTPGYNGADFKAMLENARIKKFRHYVKTKEMTLVSQFDLELEIRNFGR